MPTKIPPLFCPGCSLRLYVQDADSGVEQRSDGKVWASCMNGMCQCAYGGRNFLITPLTITCKVRMRG